MMPRDVVAADEPKWYVLAVEPMGPVERDKVRVGEEWAVRRRLKRAGVEHYLPLEEIRQHRAGRMSNPRIVPFMPGYVFVRIAKTGAVDGIKGALKLLTGATSLPRAIPDDVIAGLRRFEDRDGKIRVRRPASQRFKKDQAIRVIEKDDGEFSGWGGFTGKVIEVTPAERVKVLLGSLNVEMPAEMLAAS